MIDAAEKLGPDKGRIQVQANRYEGLVVLVNQLIESAGTSILAGPKQLKLDEAPTEKALAVLGRLSHSKVAASNLTTSTEDTARLGFESGNSTFMINYSFVYPSAKSNAPDIYKQMVAAKYPQVDPSKPAKPPIGGINIGVSAYSKHPKEAFDAPSASSSRRTSSRSRSWAGCRRCARTSMTSPRSRRPSPASRRS